MYKYMYKHIYIYIYIRICIYIHIYIYVPFTHDPLEVDAFNCHDEKNTASYVSTCVNASSYTMSRHNLKEDLTENQRMLAESWLSWQWLLGDLTSYKYINNIYVYVHLVMKKKNIYTYKHIVYTHMHIYIYKHFCLYTYYIRSYMFIWRLCVCKWYMYIYICMYIYAQKQKKQIYICAACGFPHALMRFDIRPLGIRIV